MIILDFCIKKTRAIKFTCCYNHTQSKICVRIDSHNSHNQAFSPRHLVPYLSFWNLFLFYYAELEILVLFIQVLLLLANILGAIFHWLRILQIRVKLRRKFARSRCSEIELYDIWTWNQNFLISRSDILW